jgi:MoxR-like ATPase
MIVRGRASTAASFPSLLPHYHDKVTNINIIDSYVINHTFVRPFSSSVTSDSKTRRRVRIGNVEIPMGSGTSNILKDGQPPMWIPSRYLYRNHQQQDFLSPHHTDDQNRNQPSSSLSSESASASWLSLPPITLRHLQWMMAKDSLRQDMMLIGPPGAGACYRRRLALAYAELTQKCVEVVYISADTTESDLKQRRELVFHDSRGSDNNGLGASSTSLQEQQQHHHHHQQQQAHVEFVDQAPVRAAKYGRLLILDGIEKAERNVLPTLNNLLENREMHLEDGTLLLPSHRIQELATSSSSSSSSFVIPVHPDFRVIALGVPSPPFPGRTLDPPIRSRFQIRRIDNPSSDEYYELLLQQLQQQQQPMNDSNNSTIHGMSESTLARACAVMAGAMEESGKLFPSNTLESTWRVMADFPMEDRNVIFQRAYPMAKSSSSQNSNKNSGTRSSSNSRNKNKTGSTDMVDDFNVYFPASMGQSASNQDLEFDSAMAVSRYVVESVALHSSPSGFQRAKISFASEVPSTLSMSGDSSNVATFVDVLAPCGTGPLNVTSSSRIVHTKGFRSALAAMMQEHSSGNKDIVLVSSKGEGKNVLAKEFASLLGYETHLFAIYTEMSSQNLLLRRATDASTGETTWEESPLLKSARKGDVCILDGIEKLRPDVLSSLQGFLVDRDMALPDGRRAVRADRMDDPTTLGDSVLPVHPSFRVVALASSKRGGHGSYDSSSGWITADSISMFSTIHLSKPTEECLETIINVTNPDCPDSIAHSILQLRERLTDASAEECGVSTLSVRNIVRATRRMGSTSTTGDLYDALASVFLLDLLPPRQRSMMESILRNCGIHPTRPSAARNEDHTIQIDDETATIGSLTIQRNTKVMRPELVPSPKAYDIPAHTRIIQDFLHDWKAGERSMLLLGNQGVGKNKIIDRICEIANWEREYIQLHRDSTIGQLTLTPQLENGRVVWNDSPLVRAVRDGCVLVVDEADKAPVEVVSVLKGLVEDGELLLADGRRISRTLEGPEIIKIHPNFSLWVLANRPGFPFLGNDFFREVGDCFSTRVIQNPDLDSEMTLLRAYAPSLDPKLIRSIAASFGDLRHASDNGDISYPYSTREAIAIAKHMEAYGEDGIVSAIHNVLDFDSFDEQTYKLLGTIFQKHGIPVTDYPRWKEALLARTGGTGVADDGGRSSDELRIEYLNPDGTEGTSLNPPKLSSPKFGKWDDKNEAHVGGNQWAGGTGGSDTAGLGGRGGPYRLDRGPKIHQVSEESKQEVSDESKAVARQIAQNALAERLKEIGMSEQEYETYLRFATPIQEDIAKLKSILDSVDLRSSERSWLKKQSYGEMDDTRLIDGIAGDKYIYKRRGNTEEAPDHKKKHVRFVLDVSGSMYRFNSYDQRLVRCLEAALLIMESFKGYESTKFDYSIVGHNGDSPCVQLVDWATPPQNEMERIRILQSMIAHSQYCSSGDYTLESVGHAINEVANLGGNDDGGGGVVICLSDANLARYGIDPRQLRKIIDAGTTRGVQAYVVFIASFGEEADDIKRSLPVGRGYICMETTDIPKVVREILASKVLK